VQTSVQTSSADLHTMVFVNGGGNGKAVSRRCQRELVARGAAKVGVMNEARQQQQSAARAAQQPPLDAETKEALAELRAQKKKKELARPRSEPARLAPMLMRRFGKLVEYKPSDALADGFRLIDLDNLHGVLARMQCLGCRKIGTMCMHADRERRRGLASARWRRRPRGAGAASTGARGSPSSPTASAPLGPRRRTAKAKVLAAAALAATGVPWAVAAWRQTSQRHRAANSWAGW